MSFPRYPKYKASGVEWLGEVPEHWEITRIGNLFREVSEAGSDNLPILSVSIHNGVSDKEMSDNELDRKVTRSEDKSKYIRVAPGDLVYNMMRAWQGGFGTVSVEGMVSPAYVVARPKSGLATAYVEHILRTPPAIEQMRRYSKGVTDFRLRLYWDEFRNMRVPVPPSDETGAICLYIARLTESFEEMTAVSMRAIELLAEKRQAVISHAVAKGLDPTVPMKPSGVEWLGEVPKHWYLTRIKRLSSVISKGTTPTTVGAEFTEDGVRFLKAENVTEEGVSDHPEYFISQESHLALARSALEEGDVLVVIAGATTGKSAVLGRKSLPANTNQAVSFIRPANRDRGLSEFVCHWLKMDCVRSLVLLSSVQSAQPNLSMEDLGNIPIAIPPRDERDRLLTETALRLNGLDTLTTEAHRAISLLQERRTALISAAVTGQIDVRGMHEAV